MQILTTLNKTLLVEAVLAHSAHSMPIVPYIHIYIYTYVLIILINLHILIYIYSFQWSACYDRTYEIYSEPNQRSKMELFARFVNDFRPLTIFAKISILDCSKIPESIERNRNIVRRQ